MEALKLDNDARGWIMCLVSGVACVAGASIICVDLIVRLFPGRRNFRIEESGVFKASSLSLSFGVMLFSALVGMYPSSKAYLRKAGYSGSATGWIILGCFIAGFIGIQVISRFLHKHLPSHVMGCDHNHSDNCSENSDDCARSSSPGKHNQVHPPCSSSQSDGNGHVTETSRLLNGSSNFNGASASKTSRKHGRKPSFGDDELEISNSGARSVTPRRPSMVQVQNRVMSFVKDTKPDCDEGGACFGYTGPCGQECLKHLGSSHTIRRSSLRPNHSHTTADNHSRKILSNHPPEAIEEDDDRRNTDRDHDHNSPDSCSFWSEEDVEHQHHHHVPENPFLSIGLQTSIAIALHKLPEGFITYATNHANPSLGFTVFVALFIHNITEGFAMALPLYLALGSRMRAILWSVLLGGISQPLGAGLAALWFKLAQHTRHDPGFTAYGCMFAATAGIMSSVAIQLFTEALALNHNNNLVTAFALVGMAIMGTSSALTAE